MSEHILRILKILSGPNAGAEVELPPGDIVIGNGDECDIILADSAMAARHVLLRLAEQGVTATPLDGVVVVDGNPLQAEGAVINDFVLFTIGGTHICLGPANAPWPSIALPSLVERSETAPSSPDDAQVATTPLQVAPSPLQMPENQPAARAPAARRLVPVLASIVVILVLAGAFLLGRGEVPSTPGSRVAQRLRQQGFSELHVVEAEGAVTISGTIETRSRRQLLDDTLAGIVPEPKLQINVTEDMASSLQTSAAKQGMTLKVANIGGNTLRVTGYLRDEAAMSQFTMLSEAIRKNVADIRMQTTDWKTLEPEIVRILKSRGLKGRMSMTPEPYSITVAASLTSDERNRWDEMRNELADLLQAPLPITGMQQQQETPQVIAIEAPAQREGRPSTVSASISCPQAEAYRNAAGTFMVMHGDQGYPVGALLPGGIRIQEISRDFIVLVDRSHTLYCPAGGRP